MRHMFDDGEVMADEQKCQAELCLQIAEQVDDLGLHRHVERGNRFVADDEIGFCRKRACNADALALAAGEFMRPTINRIATETNLFHQIANALIDGSLVGEEAEIMDRFGQNIAHFHARIEARKRILEDNLNPAAQRAQRAIG